MSKKVHILGGGVVELRQDIHPAPHANVIPVVEEPESSPKVWEHDDAPFFEPPVVEEPAVKADEGDTRPEVPAIFNPNDDPRHSDQGDAA
jgi:hypothetical protein